MDTVGKDMFTPAQTGLAIVAFSRARARNLQWWRELDYRAAVLFWCSDLATRSFSVGSTTLFEVVTPSGKRVSFSTTERGAWVVALALVFDHLVRVRKERRDAEAIRFLEASGEDRIKT